MRAALFIVALFQSISLVSQNLVPNPSFEIHSGCPIGYGNMNLVRDWGISHPHSTPDYFNSCANDGYAGVPENLGGFQYAKTGIAYVGILCSQQQSANNVREYIQTILIDTLVKNQTYFLSFYTNLSKRSMKGVSTIGAKFSISDSFSVNEYMLNEEPDVENIPSVPLADTVNWMRIEGKYMAKGGEKYLTIGNFRDDNNSGLFIASSSLGNYAYYYIDDVCVSLNPADCGIDTNTTNVANMVKQENEFKIFPNPAKESLSMIYLVGNNENISVTITNVLGQEVLNNKTLSDWGADVLNINALTNGIYFLKIMQNGQHLETRKFLIEK